MGFYPFTPSSSGESFWGTLATVATQYVTTTGLDTNDGLSWGTAKLTVQAAINALPTVGGLQVGIVEVGAGTFSISSPITCSNTQVPWVRGRGQSEMFVTGTITSPQYATVIHNTGTGDAVQITGNTGNQFARFTDMAITGNASSGNGVVVTSSPSAALERVSLDSHAAFGLKLSQVFGNAQYDTVCITRCGLVAASSNTGGLYLDTADLGNDLTISFFNSQFVSNNGFGIYIGGGTAISFFNCTIQGTIASSASNSGVGVFAGDTVGNGPFSFYGCVFEANHGVGVLAAGGNVAEQFFGCQFAGSGIQTFGFNVSGPIVAIACIFTGHTTASINNPFLNPLVWQACASSDSSFIHGPASIGNQPANTANEFGVQGIGVGTSNNPQTLAANGAVTLSPGLGTIQNVTLNANATSSTIDTSVAPAVVGQVMTIAWIQGAGGSHTYVWPTNCKFAAGSAPAASTTAGYQDNVTFWYDGTNWQETARAVGVH